MKNYLFCALYFLSMLMITTACEQHTPVQEEEKPEINLLSGQTVSLDPEGDDVIVSFYSAMAWSVKVNSVTDAQKWFRLSKTSGGEGNISINVVAEPNGSGKKRTASLDIISGDLTKSIVLSQEYTDLDGKNMTSDVGFKGGQIEWEIKYSGGYELDIDVDWISHIDTKALDTDILVFEVMANEKEARKGKVTLSGSGKEYVLTINQEAAPADDPGDVDGWQGVLEAGWEEKTFLHRSVAMRFTADWCGFCPIMAKGFELAKEQLPDNLEVISMHSSGGLYFPPCEDLLIYYGITGFPTGVVDGREFVYNSSEEIIAKETVELVCKAMSEYETTSGVSWVSKINSNKVRVDLAVYLKKAGSYKITALAVEDNIVGYQAGEGDSYVHNGVPRIAFTSIFGDEFTTTKDNEAVEYTYERRIPFSCNADNMRIVVYISEYDKDSGLVDDYHIDNSASGKMGGSLCLGLIVNGDGGTEDIEQGEDIEM